MKGNYEIQAEIDIRRHPEWDDARQKREIICGQIQDYINNGGMQDQKWIADMFLRGMNKYKETGIHPAMEINKQKPIRRDIMVDPIWERKHLMRTDF